ncbi:MAG: Fe3+-citrate ABC transporter substrate-binding protein, partial [Longicatena sp.]
MKKLTSLLFCIAMLFSLTACGSKVSDDALDAFEAVIQNMAKMKSADYVLTMDATNKEGDQKMTLEGSYNLQNAKPLLSASLSMEMDNEKQEDAIQFYIDGDYMYLNLMEFMKQKQSLAGMLPTEELPSLDTAADT